MANDDRHNKQAKRRPSRAGGYQPTRKPKLVGAAGLAPPPLPEAYPRAEEDEIDRFGEAAEDGLRMLAALETMPSLEPDFGDDLASEASVTIIERAARPDADAPEKDDPVTEPGATLRARLEDMGEAPDIVADEYAAYQGPVDEAIVEIFEVDDTVAALDIVDVPVPEPDALVPRRRKERPMARRFFKTLTGGSD